jgi:hypothetical protein
VRGAIDDRDARPPGPAEAYVLATAEVEPMHAASQRRSHG